MVENERCRRKKDREGRESGLGNMKAAILSYKGIKGVYFLAPLKAAQTSDNKNQKPD